VVSAKGGSEVIYPRLISMVVFLVTAAFLIRAQWGWDDARSALASCRDSLRVERADGRAARTRISVTYNALRLRHDFALIDSVEQVCGWLDKVSP
jgi:hypothetical protein